MRLGRVLASSIIVLAVSFGVVGVAAAEGVQYEKPYTSDFDIKYHLGRDDKRRSILTVTERITAEFAENTNKGIVREIPRRYDGHSVDLKVQTVTRNGQTEPIYNQYSRGDLMVIETGTDDYINGTQVFEFKYTMRDVTRFFTNTNADEFYWDTNGTGWRSYISQLSVSLTIDEDVRSQLNGNTACYQGGYGQAARCDLRRTNEGFAVTATHLSPGENATIAIGFTQGTFAEYEPTLMERLFGIWVLVTIATTAIGTAVLIWLSVRAYRKTYRTAEVGTIVPEYIPPKNASVAVSGAVLPGHMATLAAQLTDLAVRHYVQIIETRAKSTWRQAQYDIKVIRDTSELRVEEREILHDMFGRAPAVGDSLALKTLQNNNAAYMRFADNDKKLRTLMRQQYGLKQIHEPTRRWFGRTAGVLIVLSIVTLSPMFFVAALVAFTMSKALWSLSDEGLELQRYLKGLQVYIKVAEKDRLKMLQSPEGAAKVSVDANDPAQVVKLYERVLPYAILFRQEKEWSKRIGDYYESSGSRPDWYTGQSAFNAVMFSSMMTSFSSSVSTTSASSSSSGGSSGGGFSGGGGGGGGGGFR